MKSAGRVVAAIAVLLVVLLGLLLQILPSARKPVAGSVYAVDGDGRRALFLLLEELGCEPASWRSSPGHLPRGESLLLLPAVPETPPGYASPEEGDPAAPPVRPTSSRRLRDPMHYLRFIEEGGTLLATAWPEEVRFLAEELGLEELSELEVLVEELEPEELHGIALVGGERLELAVDARSWFEEPPLGSPLEVLARDDQGRAFAVSLPLGRGACVLLSHDDFLRNETLAEAENALFTVRLLEALAPRALLFDEYALGGWVPESPVALAFAPAGLPFSLHVLLVVALAVWSLTWVREFPRDPEPLGQISALSRARGYAGLAVRAGRWNLLGRMLREGVLARLAARQGAGSGPGAAPDDSAEKPDDALVERALAPLAMLLKEHGLKRARALFTAPVTSGNALDELGRELSHLERLALGGTSRDVRRPRRSS